MVIKNTVKNNPWKKKIPENRVSTNPKHWIWPQTYIETDWNIDLSLYIVYMYICVCIVRKREIIALNQS